MKFLFYIAIISFILYLTPECSNEASVLNNTDLIFHDSYYLKVKPYQFIGESGLNYFSHGDTVYYTAVPDTFDSKPLIKWDSIGVKIITAAIFTSPIVVEYNSIKNSNDIIWEWNSGMKVGREGIVKYTEGRNILKNGSLDYDYDPKPLNSGMLYYWAVWAWNPEGTKIYYSSRQMSFYVQ
jgi:hypothetical protein